MIHNFSTKEIYRCSTCDEYHDHDTVSKLNWKCPNCSSLITIGIDGQPKLWFYRIPASKLRENMSLIRKDSEHAIHQIIPINDTTIRLVLGGFGKLDILKTDYVNVDLFDADDEDF